MSSFVPLTPLQTHKTQQQWQTYTFLYILYLPFPTLAQDAFQVLSTTLGRGIGKARTRAVRAVTRRHQSAVGSSAFAKKKVGNTKNWGSPLMPQYLLQVGLGCRNKILLGIWSIRDLIHFKGIWEDDFPNFFRLGYGLVPWRVRVLAHLLRMASWNVNYFALRFGDCTPLHYPLTFGEPGCL